MADLLLGCVTMKRMENVMHHHIFSYYRKMNREFTFLMTQKEKIRRYFATHP